MSEMNAATPVLADESELSPSPPSWAGCSGAIGGCLTVVSCISFALCLGANYLQSLYTIDDLGVPSRAFPQALPITWALCALTLLAAVLGGAALGLRVFAYKEMSAVQALRVTFASSLLPIRYIVGVLQFLASLFFCYLLLAAPHLETIVWPIGAFIVLTVLQIALWLTTAVLGGSGFSDAMS